MTIDCVKCGSDLDHCHGTLVAHADGMVECTELRCGDFDQVRHGLIIECHDVQGGCACLEIFVAEPLRRAS